MMRGGREKGLAKLRVELVGCPLGCEAVQPASAQAGHVPRIIHLEQGEAGGSAVIVVGMNPGDPGPAERKVVQANAGGNKQDIAAALYEFFEQNILFKHQYYVRVRQIARELGFRGAILWTEAVKCSSATKGSLNVIYTPATFRACGDRWLREECLLAPADWPIVAVGRDAFVASVLMRDRRVLGIPHASARSPAFWRVFQKGGDGTLRLRAATRKKFGRWRDGGTSSIMLTGS